MADQPKNLGKITSGDVEAVTERMKKWLPTLPEQEQLVLGWILTRAATADDADVAEYTERTAGAPVSALMAEAAGLQDVAGYMMPIKTVGPVKIWTFRF